MKKTRHPRHKSSHASAEDDMMDLGFFTSSSSSSSSSNLSPLAPPFTIARSNRNKLDSSSNLDSHFNGKSDAFGSNWPYLQSSTATLGLLADSVRTATVPSVNFTIPDLIDPPNTQNWSAMNSSVKSGLEPLNPSVANLGARNPNLQPLIWSFGDDDDDDDDNDTPFVVPPNFELLPSRSLFYGYESSQVDYSESLSGLKYDSQPVGTWCSQADGSRGKEDSAMFGGVFGVTRENNIGSSNIGKSHDTSFCSTNHGFSIEPWNGNRSYTPFETRPKSYSFSCGPKSPSITKSSPSVVIKPPVSTKSLEISSTAVFNSNNALVSHNPLQDMSNKMSTDINSPSFEFKASSNFQVPDINSTKLSEHPDHHNPAEDSPCWKGAPTHFSPYGSSEAESSQHHMKKLQKSIGVNLEHSLSEHLFNHSLSVSSLEKHENSEKDHMSGGTVVVGLDSAKGSKSQTQSSCDIAKPTKGYGCLSEPSSDANSQASEMKSPNLNEDVPLPEMKIQLNDIDNLVTDERFDVNIHVKALTNLSELLLLHCSKNECGLKVQDHKAVDLNEDVPLPEMKIQLNDVDNLVTDERFDVNIHVKALTNLSELLLLHCSKNECGLKVQDHKALDHVIHNLNVCMSTKIQQMDHFGKKIEELPSTCMRDDDLPKDYKMIQKIKKVLDEDLDCKQDLPSHIYKNMWLEAEAELCTLSYRARFNRAKKEMDKLKASGFNTSNTRAHNPSLPSVDDLMNDVDNSVMSRFNILKQRGESHPLNMVEKDPDLQSPGMAEEPHLQHHFGKDDALVMHSHGNQNMQSSLAMGTKDVEHSVMARLNVLKSRGESDFVNIEPQVLADGVHSAKDEKLASYGASSDWEHVLKNEFS